MHSRVLQRKTTSYLVPLSVGEGERSRLPSELKASAAV